MHQLFNYSKQLLVLLKANGFERADLAHQHRWYDQYNETDDNDADIEQQYIYKVYFYGHVRQIIGRLIEFKDMGILLDKSYAQPENIANGIVL